MVPGSLFKSSVHHGDPLCANLQGEQRERAVSTAWAGTGSPQAGRNRALQPSAPRHSLTPAGRAGPGVLDASTRMQQACCPVVREQAWAGLSLCLQGSQTQNPSQGWGPSVHAHPTGQHRNPSTGNPLWPCCRSGAAVATHYLVNRGLLGDIVHHTDHVGLQEKQEKVVKGSLPHSWQLGMAAGNARAAGNAG